MFIVLSRSRGCTGEAPCSCTTAMLAEGAMICLVKICPHSPLGYRVEAEACNKPRIMKCNTQNLECHPERSEGSLCPASQTLPLRKFRASAHCAQGDTA